MGTHRYAHGVLLLLAFASVAPAAQAAVTITEVMYDPPGSDKGREWIELYNDGVAAASLGTGSKGWRINDGSNHVLTDPAGAGELSLVPGGYLIVSSDPATFAAQYGTGVPVVKAALNLTNTAGTVSLIDQNGAVADSVSYNKGMGGYDDGLSLHRFGATLAARQPNPGAAPSAAAAQAPTAPQSTAKTSTAKKTSNAASRPKQSASTHASDASAVVAGQGVDAAAAAAAPGAQASSLWLWLAALGGLILLGAASVWYLRAGAPAATGSEGETPPPADEFEIV